MLGEIAAQFYSLNTLGALAGTLIAGFVLLPQLGMSRSTFCVAVVNLAIGAGTADAVVSGGFIAPSPGSVTVQFSVSQAFPRLTLVSMVAPSPDWFVGVAGLELFDGAVWVSNAVVTLYPLDAGTDDGPSYLSPDADSSPHVPISTISSGPLGNATPLGTFTLQRLDLDPVPATSVTQRRVLAVLLVLAGLGLMLRDWLRRRAA